MSIFWHNLALTFTIVGYLLTFLLIPWVLLTKKDQPVSTVAWILAIVSLPYFGGLLFLVFGINRVDRRAAVKQRASRNIDRRLPTLAQYQLIPGETTSWPQKRLMHLVHRVTGATPTFGNRIELLPDTNQALGLIEQAIRAATETLHLEYYIWEPDKTGTRVRDLLIEKAKEGVKVRFLYDALGSMYLTRRFLQPMRDAGIHVAPFLPGASFRERWSINLRNHRKIVIADGAIGFTGGMNIGDEYLGLNPGLGYWRDTHMRLIGPAVLQLQQIFAEDWFYATGEELTSGELYPEPAEPGDVTAQVIAGGPDEDVSVFHALNFTAINEARDRITLATSYFVPPHSLETALATAAYRGVQVRLLLAGKSAYAWTTIAGRSYYSNLLNAGVEIYEYERGLLHSKTLTIDGNWSMVGTPNFDNRSLHLNFEVAVASDDARIARQLEEHFDEDIRYSRRIDPREWQRRPVRQALAESLCRLFAPVL